MERGKTISAIKGVLLRHRVRKAYLFGSFARGERRYRDIDIAIVLPAGKFSLLDLVGMEQELEGKTGKKAEVSILNSIKPALLPYIRKDLTAIL